MLLAGQDGQDRAAGFLQAAWRADRLAHAYALVGPVGVGQGDLVRAFAAARLCENVEWDACGRCPTCRRVMAGIHPDVLWFEPEADKREITLDVIETLQEQVGLKPYEAPLRTVAVRAADRMNADAANRFLKTLEEPSGHTGFFLLVSDWDRLLPTVKSRVQMIRLAPLTGAQFGEAVRERVEQSEDADLSVARLSELAPLAQGSATEALALLESEFPILRDLLRDYWVDPPRGTEAQPVTAAKALIGTARVKDCPMEVTRRRLRAVVFQAAIWLRDAIAAANGIATLDPDAPQLTGDPWVWLDRLESLWDLLDLLDRNVNLDLWTTQFWTRLRA